jgi:tetratricopeptide (TPR) repeat protein
MVSDIVEFPGAGDILRPGELEETVADGDAGLRMGRPDLALKIFDLALKIMHLTQRPENPALLYRRAVALSALGRAAEAVEAYDRTIAMEIPSPEFQGRCYFGRAHLLMHLRRHPEMLADTTKAVECCPDLSDVLRLHALALAFCGRGDDAIEVYDDIVARQKSLTVETVGIDLIIAERDAIVRLLLEGAVE